MAGVDTREAKISLEVDGGVVLERFDVMERLSELFVIHAQVLCTEMVDFFPHLGDPVVITVQDEAGSPVRYFHGLLFEADYVETVAAGHRYQLVLRPWLYILSRNLDYNINQDKNAVDIVKELFEKRNRSDVDYAKLSGSTKVRPYCVQYRESDFQFFSRLMEEEGIYYFFRHSEDKHQLVLCNARSSHAESEYSSLPFVSPSGGIQSYSDRLWQWNERVGSSGEKKATLRNFDFERPALKLEGDHDGGATPPVRVAEIYDYPAVFMEPDEGKTLGQTIVQSAQREGRVYLGEGDATALACGLLFKLADHPIDRLNQEYLLVGLRYSLESQAYRSGGGSAGVAPSVSVEAVPADVHWRAPIRTPKPVARGPETAMVTGPSGEVIYTDEYGRVKVQFHWDRVGKNDDKTTCFIRVSHSSADGGFGHIVLPRIGQEVIVDYLNGDPDRPIITGRLYNKDKMQAEVLPDQKTRSTWRSQTVGQIGGYDGAEKGAPPEPWFNAIGMEDKGGKEKLVFWAQRERVNWVWLDDDFWVNRDEKRRVGRNRKTEIKNNETLTVEEGDMSTTVSKGKQSTEVTMGDKTIKVSGGNMSTDVTVGNWSLKTDAGAITMEAMQKIELKVLGNSIKIDPTGVTINGIMVKIEGQAMLQATAPMTQINGDAMTTVKGAVVMIN